MRAPARPRVGQGAAGILLCLAYGGVVHRLLSRAAYVPANVSAAALSVLLAQRWGVTRDDLGMRRDRAASGLRLGLASTVPVGVAIAAGVAAPVTRPFFLDERVVRTGDVLTTVLVRIPVGTALAEEVIFRGALLGVFLRRHRPVTAALLTSMVFGLWHVLPAFDQLRANPLGALIARDSIGTAVAVGGNVLFAAAAGFGFAWLRLRAGSVLAPVVTHAGANVLAFLGGRVASRLGPS